MTATADHRPGLRGPAVREAIVDAATALFAEHGIRAVSADRILADAGFSKVTFYRHFPTKDDVVVAYLARELDSVRGLLATAAGEDLGLEEIAAALTDQMCRPHFRGCPFINAAAEYPDPDHPVRALVAEFRGLMTEAIAAWLEGAGLDAAGAATGASQVMMLRDGALVAGYLDGEPDQVARDLADGIRAIIGLSA
ncbi:TetR/AcrR family transcriptional regulator [Demequina mangrovi]|uniref:Transcriptional regulator, TetR family n=1 Tax=Demequina mangrovi TaxID=1043493 RepID=A0A1H6UJR0_9MICO|nr:TetR/AcrR family transcriptional regulator [Demequina mangrovi]SEI88072.1 transcriptional regulator, TetR family [Demequina mangrovi]